LAPTGVAAVNVGGQTIHSFFQIRPGAGMDEIKKINKDIFKKLDALVIDEVSMARADLMDMIDQSLRLNRNRELEPFGGVQMILIGDLYKITPVLVGQERRFFRDRYQSEYFFDADVIQSEEFEMELVELEKIYRQKGDGKFIDLLNAVRNNSIDQEQFDELNKRCNPNLEPSEDDLCINLTPTNKASEEFNRRKLISLDSPEVVFQGKIEGQYNQSQMPTDLNLALKEGAQVMLLNNNSAGKWVNGTVGKIVRLARKRNCKDSFVIVELENDREIKVKPHSWEIFNYYYDQLSNSIKAETVGSFTQLPIKLAWSVTIHKSQGKTFDKVMLDIGRGTFAHGQTYVALSRCRSLEGLVLKKPLEKKHIWMDWKIVKFLTEFQYEISEKELSFEDKEQIIRDVIEKEKALEITYLKASDIKSERVIEPIKIGEMLYLGKNFNGLEAFCRKRNEKRVFRIDRILEMRVVE
jgi:ATP-dependent DNA helicase PIF1